MSAPCSPGSDPDPPYNPSFSPLPCFRLGFLPVDPPGDPRILTPVLSTTRHTSPGYDTLPLRVARHLSPLAPPVFVFHHGVDLSATHPSFPRATPRILVSSPLFRPPFLWVACRLSTPARSMFRLPSRGCSRRLLEGLGSLIRVLLDSTFPHFDCRAHHSRLGAGSRFTGENASSNLSYSPAFWSVSFLVQGTISTNKTCHSLVARKRCPAGGTHKGREPLLPTGFVSRFYGASSGEYIVSCHKLVWTREGIDAAMMMMISHFMATGGSWFL